MKNNEKVFLLIDTSGSMIENEKPSILIYIYRPFKTIIGNKLLSYSWGDEIKKVNMYFVGIGSDVDKKILEYTFGKNSYFEAYDILNLANWLKREIS